MKAIMVVFLLIPTFVVGQKLESSIRNSDSDQFISPELRLNWILRENAVEIFSSSDLTLIQGSDSDLYKVKAENIHFNPRKEFQIYPNQARTHLMVEKPDTEMYMLRIIDQKGRLIKSTFIEAKITRVNLGMLPSGIYFLSLRDRVDIVQWVKIYKQD